MDLLDRYLNAVRLALVGRPRRDDIIAELRDDLLSRIEARESETCRPLRLDELEDVLKANGHPLVAAGRYRERQYLIGPTILPFYEAAVVVLLAILAVVTLSRALIAPSTMHAVHGVFEYFISSAVAMIGAVTVVAVMLERWEVRLGFAENWRPRDLPDFATDSWSPSTAVRRGPWMLKDKTRWQSLCELAITLVFLCLWTGLVSWPTVWRLSPHGEVTVTPEPIWRELFWPILVLGVLQASAAAIRFVQPHWTRRGAAVDLVSALVGLAIIAMAAQHAPWFTLHVVAGMRADSAQTLSGNLPLIITACLCVSGMVWGVQALQAIYRLVAGSRPPVV